MELEYSIQVRNINDLRYILDLIEKQYDNLKEEYNYLKENECNDCSPCDISDCGYYKKSNDLESKINKYDRKLKLATTTLETIVKTWGKVCNSFDDCGKETCKYIEDVLKEIKI